MAWSKAQLKAITTYNKNLLVAAAAGSGKTSVLVERIIQRLLSGNCNIDEILVVTFTNAAAAEMRERIALAIDAELKKNPQSSHLERQLVLLNTASISTLHSFCQTIIRQNFHLLDLDPKFRLANQQEMNLLKRDVLEAIFEEGYESNNAEFLSFVDAYADERSDEEMYGILLKLYEFSRSQPYPEHWIGTLPENFVLSEAMTVDDTPWPRIIKEQLTLVFEECRVQCDELVQMAQELDCTFYLPVLHSDLEIILHLQDLLKTDWETLRNGIYAVKFATLTAPRGTDVELKTLFQKPRQQVKEQIKTIKEVYFMSDSMELMDDLRQTAPLIRAICDMTVAFANGFAAAKRTKMVVDFSDLEHFALQILLDETATAEQLKPSVTALNLQQKYVEVMVDEYQDTNGVQEAILSLVRKSSVPNLFVVGDVKQSIYRFRLADPELFLKKYREYPTAGSDFARIDLAQNFRSRAGILEAINYIFAQVMSEKAMELPYGAAEQLNPGPPYPEGEGTLDDSIEVDLIDRDETGTFSETEFAVGETQAAEKEETEELKGFPLEARFITNRIQTLMDEKKQVFDKATKTYRPLEWRDIVILLRSVKGKANILLEILHANNIPAYAAVDSGYFEETEVRIMLALLNIIDNPRQDIPLASILYSPIIGLSPVMLAKIKLLQPNDDLFAALLLVNEPSTEIDSEVKEKVMKFVLQLSSWRNLARCSSVPDLIWQLFRDTGYYDYVGGMPGGLLRQANLRVLYDRAREYETTNFRGLFRFLRFVDKMQDTGTDLAVARTLGESENVVRVMSIHKSKGLEFPVVIVADLGKKFNLQDSSDTLLVHRKYGLGPFVSKPDISLRYPTIARQAIACLMNRESKAEELRVLYVALTRAREKLILVGSSTKLADRALNWCRNIDLTCPVLPTYTIAGAKTYLDWIGAALARHEDGKVLRDFAQTTKKRLNIVYENHSRWEINIIPASNIQNQDVISSETEVLLAAVKAQQILPGSPQQKWVEQVLNWQYPDKTMQEVPAKLSVTEMKRRFEVMDTQALPLFKPKLIVTRPRFIQEQTQLTGAEYGTLMHGVMQHIDFCKDLSENGLKLQLESLVNKEMILPKQISLIDLAGVHKFFTSPLGQRMIGSAKVRRELPFSIMLQAKKFYPDILDEQENIFVQGIIDVLFDEPDGMVLIDYKTDKNTQTEALINKYKLQINLYSEAAEKILKKDIKEKYLYLFHNGTVIPMD
ncbi:helicase-exonuclease AddAB subunit AddA [Propionispira raffinosivorans]|uniref:helicase-exonuclease AddAB subunit AddA n=1 Tax=Propionispira raffinosivorans TaxID=86959 RepID=UPI00037AE58B|nr:helicase-exonuclease AddAB subunit AddA [Propionispira raffinosivorans]